MAVTTSNAFVAQLEQSKLLGDDELAEARTSIDGAADAMAAAKLLVKANVLTRWQAGQLLGGRSQLVLGKYKLLERLGSGGMGSVYLAEHSQMKRRVALKTLSSELSQSRSAMQRLVAEARAIAALDHPNIIRAYDLETTEGLYYIVMEYVAGRDLERIVKDGGPLRFQLAADYVRQAASGLAHAHERGMVHRDIKPANLLVDKNGVIKILDLGIASLTGRDESQLSQKDGDQVEGTVDYLAPEQAVGGQIDGRSDVYSLGCTLYFLLSGHAPFPAGSMTERLAKHQMEEPADLATERSGVPGALVEICRRMMAKQPGDRYQKASEVESALARWIASSPDATNGRTRDSQTMPAVKNGKDSRELPRRRTNPGSPAPGAKSDSNGDDSLAFISEMTTSAPAKTAPAKAVPAKGVAANAAPAKGAPAKGLPAKGNAAKGTPVKGTAVKETDDDGEKNAAVNGKAATGAKRGGKNGPKRSRRTQEAAAGNRKRLYIGLGVGGTAVIALAVGCIFAFSGGPAKTDKQVAKDEDKTAAVVPVTDADKKPDAAATDDKKPDASKTDNNPNTAKKPDEAPPKDTKLEPKKPDTAPADGPKPDVPKVDGPKPNAPKTDPAKPDQPAAADKPAADANPLVGNVPGPAKEPGAGDKPKEPGAGDAAKSADPVKPPDAPKPPDPNPAKPKSLFDTLPATVDLPALPKGADAGDASVNLAKIDFNKDSTLDVALLLPTRKGKAAAFKIARKDAGADSHDWQITSGAEGDNPPIATVSWNKDGLSFHWAADAGKLPANDGLRNSMLEFNAGAERKAVALRSPKTVEKLVVDLDRVMPNHTVDIAWMPEPENVFLEVKKAETREPKTTTQTFMTEATIAVKPTGKQDPVQLNLGDDKSKPLQINVSILPRPGKESPRLIVHTMMLVSNQWVAIPQTTPNGKTFVPLPLMMSGLDQTTKGMDAQIKKASDAKLDKTAEGLKQQKAAMDAQYKELEKVKAVYDKTGEKIPLSFRMFLKIDDKHEIELVNTGAEPVAPAP